MFELIVMLLIFYKIYKKFAEDPNKSKTWQNQKYSPKQNYHYPTNIQKPKIMDDHCIIEPSNDPIQDGSKANSILGTFWGNKIEKL